MKVFTQYSQINNIVLQYDIDYCSVFATKNLLLSNINNISDIWLFFLNQHLLIKYFNNLLQKVIYAINRPFLGEDSSISYDFFYVLGLISTFFLSIRNYFTNKSDLKSPNILKKFVFANLYYQSSLDTNCKNGMSEELLQKIYVKV